MTKWYLLAKKIHRVFALITTFLTLVMAITGLMLKYTGWTNILTFVEPGGSALRS